MTDRWEAIVLAAWGEGQRISAVGPGSLDDHLTHARRLVELIDPAAGVGIDLGSGAGIPGLALAGLRPDMRWILVDAAKRRTRVLTEAVAAAGWTERVEVVHERAELLPRGGHRERADVVTARLFGPPAVTAECAAPLLALGAQLLVSEPPADVAGRWDPAGLTLLGLSLGPRWSDPPTQELRRTGTPEDRFPRKPGVAEKRPLW